jgi:Na+/H+ antiporter NhaC
MILFYSIVAGVIITVLVFTFLDIVNEQKNNRRNKQH